MEAGTEGTVEAVAEVAADGPVTGPVRIRAAGTLTSPGGTLATSARRPRPAEAEGVEEVEVEDSVGVEEEAEDLEEDGVEAEDTAGIEVGTDVEAEVRCEAAEEGIGTEAETVAADTDLTRPQWCKRTIFLNIFEQFIST